MVFSRISRVMGKGIEIYLHTNQLADLLIKFQEFYHILGQTLSLNSLLNVYVDLNIDGLH